MERDKIQLHRGDSGTKPATLIDEHNLSLLKLEESRHKSAEANTVCKMQLKVIKHNFPSLISRIEEIIDEEEGKRYSDQFRTNIGELSPDQIKHARELLHNLVCHTRVLTTNL